MSRYQWRFVWSALAAWVASFLLQWVGRPRFDGTVDEATVYIVQSMLAQVAFYLGVLFAGGAVLLAVLRSDRADRYELEADEDDDPAEIEPDGPFAGMID